MASLDALRNSYDAIRCDAELFAGGLRDLAQRAAVYRRLFRDSGRNHVFPLIAAHGALWAGDHFRFGMKLGSCCSWLPTTSLTLRTERLRQLSEFADAFRDINRCVCIETYTTWHFTAEFGKHPDADQLVPRELLTALNGCHAARRNGHELSTEQKRHVFQTFFLNEQDTVVGPRIEAALRAFDWPMMKFIAIRPLVRFAYFGRRRLFFRNFCDQRERVTNGLRAFDIAAAAGWDHVESALNEYCILPASFSSNADVPIAAVGRMAFAGANSR
ncbi:MAG: hypothetical protein R3C19_24990 [Planctomycetaceae bacterium]